MSERDIKDLHDRMIRLETKVSSLSWAVGSLWIPLAVVVFEILKK